MNVINNCDKNPLRGGIRDSALELFRIVNMLVIVMHHYVVNSGVIDEITPVNVLSANSLFALLAGLWGKTAINCFVLISGYFMCKSEITVRKFVKLLCEIEFYNLGFFLLFWWSGYMPFSLKSFIKAVFPIYGIGTEFVGSYLVFYLFMPFINRLIKSLNGRSHLALLALCLFYGTILPTFLKAGNAFTYVGWFMVLYLLASYIRLYPKALFDNKKVWTAVFLVCVLLSWCSVLCGAWIYRKAGILIFDYFLQDCNKIMALATAVSAFLFFKNLRLHYYPVINKIAAATFGVLMIHANSDAMRQWLWKDLLNNVGAYHSSYFIVHAVCSVVGVYAVCTVIDMIRIRFVESWFLGYYDRHLQQKVERLFK